MSIFNHGAMFFRSIIPSLALFLFPSLVWAAERHFEGVDNEEKKITGTLTALDKTQAIFDVQGTSQTVPLEKLIKIRSIAPNPYATSSIDSGNSISSPLPLLSANRNVSAINALQSKESIAANEFPKSVDVLELVDGSRLTVTSFTMTDNQAAFRLVNQQSDVTLPLNSLSAVRFSVGSLTEVINPPENWLRLAVPHADGDRLIIGKADSFDVYTGILQRITADRVSFVIDGEALPVPRQKVFGFVLHHVSPPSNSVPLGTVSFWSGTKAVISDIRLQNNELSWTNSSGLTATVPLEMVEEIDFGEKGVAFLTDLEWTHSEFSLPFASALKPAQFAFLQSFYENRSKKPAGGVVLEGTYYERSITLKGKTLLEYRLPKPFTSFKAVIGIENQYRPYALSTLKILADSQMLGTWELRGDAGVERIQLNLPQSCRTLTIIAEPPPQSNVPAVLTIAEPKLFE